MIESRRLILEWLEKHGKNITGHVLNAGAGDDRFQYHRFFPKAKSYTTVDIDPGCAPDIVADIQYLTRHEKMRSRLSYYSAVVSTGLMYQIPEPIKVSIEVNKILMKGGTWFVTFPYRWTYPFEREPRDLWRFTLNSVDLILKKGGFRSYMADWIATKTEPVYEGWLVRALK